MAEIQDTFGASKAATVSQTTAFVGSDLKDGALKYIVECSTLSLADVQRLRVKSNGKPQIDVAPLYYRAFLERFSLNREILASAATSWSLIGHMEDADIEPLVLPGATAANAPMALAHQSGFEFGGAAVEVAVSSTYLGSGTIKLGWTREEPPLYTVTHDLLAEAMNVGTSATNGRYDISKAGWLRGFVIETTGLVSVQLYIQGKLVINATKAQLVESQATQDANTAVTLTQQGYRFSTPWQLGPGSYFLVTTDGSWGGVNTEIALYVMRNRNDNVAGQNKAGA